MKRIGQIIISLILSVCIAMSNIVLVSAASIGQVKSLKAKTVTYNSVTLSWKKVKGVTGYQIQQYVNKKWKTIKKDNKKTTYTVKKLKTGTKYKFRVRAYKKSGKKSTYGKYSKTLSVTPVPAKVKAKVASVTVNSAKLSWSKVSGASGYYVQKKDGKKWKTVATLKSKSKSYTVKKLSLGKTYSYRVVAFRTVNKKKIKGTASSTLKVKPAVPQPKSVKVSDVTAESAVISWSKASGAEGYQVQKKNGDSWATVANVKDKTQVTVSVVPDEEAIFRVRAYKGKYYSTASSTVKALYTVAAAQELSVALVDEDSVLLTWMAADDVAGYEVQLLENGKWTTAATVTDTNYDLSVAAGKKYEIRVVSFVTADGKDYFGEPSNTVSVELEEEEAPSVTVPSTNETPSETKPTTTNKAEEEKPSTTKPTTTKPTSTEPVTTAPSTEPVTEPTTVPTATVPSTEPATVPSTSPSTTKEPTTKEPSTTKASETTAPTTTQKPASAPTVNAAKYLKSTVSDGKINLSWTAPSGGATGYEVQRLNGSTWETIATVTGTSASVTAEPGVTYEFRVVSFKTVDGQTYYGKASGTEDAKYTVPAPTGFSVSSSSKNGASLTWKAASGVTGYEVQRQDGSVWTTVLTTDKTSATAPLEPGVTTYFRVVSYVSYNSKNYYSSATASRSTKYTVPYASSLKVTANKDSSSLTWKAASGVDGYEVQRLDVNTWNTVANVTGTSASVFAVPGVQHSYRVLSYVIVGGKSYYGSATSTVRAKYTIYYPSTLKLGTVTKDAASLSWKAAEGVDGYEIQKQEGSSWVKLATSATNSGSAPIAPGTQYTLRVVAYVTAGGVNYYSSATGTVNAKYDLGSASDLKTTAVTKDTASLTWTAAKDAYKYEVQQNNGSAWTVVSTVDTTSADISIVPNTTYKLRVVPVVASNGKDYKGGASNEISVIYTVPVATNLTAVDVAKTSATLTWNAAADAEFYEVQLLSDSAWTTVASAVSGTSYDITIIPDVTYNYRVIAVTTVNGNNYKSAPSNEAAVKYTVPSAFGLKVTDISDTTVTLLWTAAEGVDGYVVYNGTEIAATVTDTTVTITDLTKATAYPFTVKAIQVIDGVTYYSAPTNTVTGKTTPDKVTVITDKVKAGQSTVYLEWEKEAVADGYTVYVKNASGGWDKVADTSALSYTVSGLLTDAEYEFRVAAFHKSSGTPVYGEASESISLVTAFSTVEGLTIEDIKSNIIKIDWLKVEGAYYESYYKKNASSEFEQVNVGSADRDYYYLIINDETDIGFKVTDTANCKVTVIWNAVEGASKYDVQSRLAGSLGNWTTVATATGTTTTTSFMVAPDTEYELRLVAYDGAFKVRAGKDYVNAPTKYTAYEELNNIPGTVSKKIESLCVETPAFNASDKTVKTAYVLKVVQAINNTKAEKTIKNVTKTEIVETKIESLRVSHPLFFFGAWVDISEIPGVDIDELMGITAELNTNKKYTGSVSGGVYSYTMNDGTTGKSTFSKTVSPYAGDAYLYNAADINSIDSKITGITYSTSGTQEIIELTLAQEVATKSNDATPIHKGLYEDFSGTAGAPGMDDGKVTVGPTKLRVVINENGTLDSMKVTTSFEMYSQMTEEGISFRMTVDGTRVEDTYTFTR